MSHQIFNFTKLHSSLVRATGIHNPSMIGVIGMTPRSVTACCRYASATLSLEFGKSLRLAQEVLEGRWFLIEDLFEPLVITFPRHSEL